jgi:3-oxoacyl-[acyl-carrier-protein] synthase-1
MMPELEGRERMLPLIESVLDEVASTCSEYSAHPVSVSLALPEVRPGFSDGDADWLFAQVQARLSLWKSATQVRIAGRGHAGAIQAVSLAIAEAKRRFDTLFVVAGVDSYLKTETLVWLDSERRLARPGTRSGFMPGEGAGCLVLASTMLRKSCQLPHLAVVCSACTAQETVLRTSETGSFGVGLSKAIVDATIAAGLRLPNEAADAEYIDINGERYRSEEWGFVAMRVPTAFRSFNYLAPADCWGDVGAAFAPLASGLVVRSFARGYARGPRAIVLAGSESGLRGAMWIETAKARTEPGFEERTRAGVGVR